MDLEHELDLDDLGQVFVPEEPISAEDLLERVTVLDAQVQFCVDYMNDCGILDDGCFTFPDGETVHASKTLSIPVKIDAVESTDCIIKEGHGVIPKKASWFMDGNPEKPICDHHKGYYETAFDDYSDINWVPIEE